MEVLLKTLVFELIFTYKLLSCFGSPFCVASSFPQSSVLTPEGKPDFCLINSTASHSDYIFQLVREFKYKKKKSLLGKDLAATFLISYYSCL